MQSRLNIEVTASLTSIVGRRWPMQQQKDQVKEHEAEKISQMYKKEPTAGMNSDVEEAVLVAWFFRVTTLWKST